MSEIWQDALQQISGAIILIIVTLLGVVGVELKKIFEKYLDDLKKRNAAETCVEGVEQKHPELHGEAKFAKCEEYLCEMLDQKNIASTELEREMLIESAVLRMNGKTKKAAKKAENKPDNAEEV